MTIDQHITSQAAAEEVAQLAATLSTNVERVVVGKRPAITAALIAVFSAGHALIEDVPGVAKTMLARSLARSIGCDFQRVQCTPDLLPSDITGLSVFNQKTVEFEFRPGPVFSNILLADEINRATPRTQSALLECMAEGQVTLDGVSHTLARPFIVFATQNPIEYEGTFPLPEAQLDRFSLCLHIGYPDEEHEIAMLERLRVAHPVDSLQPVTDAEAMVRAQQLVRQIYVHDEIRTYLVKVVRATRAHPDVAVGAGPRASLALFRTVQALAAIQGDAFAMPDHVQMMAPAVLEHRLVLKPEARLHKRSASDVVRDIVHDMPVPVPRG